jgi:hypothetical protein
MLHSAADFSDSFCGTQNKVGTPMRVEAGLDLCAVRLIIIFFFHTLKFILLEGSEIPNEIKFFHSLTNFDSHVNAGTRFDTATVFVHWRRSET